MIEKEEVITIGGKQHTFISDGNYVNQFAAHGFRPDLVRLSKILALNTRTVIDIGAYLGGSTLLYSDLANHVWAFEPSPTSFYYLEKNMRRAPKKNISLQNLALGVGSSRTSLAYSPGNLSGAFIADKINIPDNHIVENVGIEPLDKIVKELKIKDIDFMNIEIEGYEAYVLQGGMETIQKNKPVAIIRFNHWCLNAFQRTSVPNFLDFLKSIFPILLAIDGNNYLNLHNHNHQYYVMHQQIIHMRYTTIIAAFGEAQLGNFRIRYSQG